MKPLFAFFLLLFSLTINAQTLQRKLSGVDTLTLEERLWGLTLFWHEVKSDFAFYDQLGFDFSSPMGLPQQ